jgi:group I intron endonuclease
MASLRGRCHTNMRMQKDFDAYGEDSFQIRILEECKRDPKTLRDNEEKWIDILVPFYNLQASTKIRMDFTQSAETRKRVSDGLRKAYKNPVLKEKISRLTKEGMKNE